MEWLFGLGIGKGCPLPIGHGEGYASHIFFISGPRNAHLVAFSGSSEYLLLHCNTWRSRATVGLPSLTFQADCGSIKGAGVPAEDSIEHYLPAGCEDRLRNDLYCVGWGVKRYSIHISLQGWWIRDKFNHCQHRLTTTATLTVFLQAVMNLEDNGNVWICYQ